jgi:hypothetical protein
MRTFAAQTTGVTTKDQVAYMSNQRQAQNDLAKSGGAVTVPQFSSSGLSTGTSSNDLIAGMASQQLQSDSQSKYNGCVGQSAESCAGTGGSRRRSRRRSRRSRKNKLKNHKKNKKV